MSVPGGIARTDSHQLSVSIPELAEMFDGSEEIIAIAITPAYARQTFLP